MNSNQPNNNEKKGCTKCKENKVVTDFGNSGGYIRSWCRECSNRNCRERDHGLYSRYYTIYTRTHYKSKVPKIIKYYQNKGIKCEWATYQDFKSDMYESYLAHIEKYGRKNTTIDRIDGNKNYSKENCRWVTWQKNTLNNAKYGSYGK